jgi:hypothetical protein
MGDAAADRIEPVVIEKQVEVGAVRSERVVRGRANLDMSRRVV